MPRNGSINPTPEDKIFACPINIDQVPEQGLDIVISADPATRQALAAADGLAGIGRLEAAFHVARKSLADFNVSGTLRASVTQICVVSLEPFDTDVVEEIDVDFARPAGANSVASPARGALGVDALDRDPPDPIVDGIIDLGALAAEFLALGLDPYPKKPGVEFAPVTVPPDEDAREKPFDVLRKLSES